MDSTSTSTPQRARLTVPVVLMTLGVILLLDEIIPGWGIGRTWPVLLVVYGALKLIEASQPPRPPTGPQP